MGVSAEAAPSDAIHFAYRLAGDDEPFTYDGATSSRVFLVLFVCNTMFLPDD